MSDIDDPVPPRPGARRLTRNTRDGVVFGVAAGLGDYFAVDPVIFRIGFVVLTLAGGSGLLLYLLAWLVIPESAERSSVGARMTRGWSPWTIVVAALVAVFALPALFGALIFGDGEGVVVVALVLLAVLLLANRDDGWPRRPAGGGPGAPTATAADPAEGATATGLHDIPHATAGATTASGSWASGGSQLTVDRPVADAPRRRRREPSITRLALSALLVLGGGAALLDEVDAIDVTTAGFLALALTVCGIGLLVGSRIGEARGLIPISVALTIVLAAASSLDFEVGGGVGDRIHRPTSVAEVQPRYRLGAGDLTIDLTDLPPRAFADGLDLRARVGAGELVVRVPDEVTVVARLSVGAGDISACGVRDNGVDIDREVRCGGTGRGLLRLDARAGLGQITIDQVTAALPAPVVTANPGGELR